MELSESLNKIIEQVGEVTGAPRILFIVPESAGDIFLSTSLLPSLKEMYPEYDIYFACNPEYKDILKGNEYISKVIDYLPIMESQLMMEGYSEWEGIFDISMMVTLSTQRLLNYLNNGKTRIAFNIRD